MHAALSAVTTAEDVATTQLEIIDKFNDPADHLSGLLFASGMHSPQVVTVPYKDGIVHLHHWIYDAQQLNFIISNLEGGKVSILHHLFKRFPTSHGIPFPQAYSLFYWAQNTVMPLNNALLPLCAGVDRDMQLKGDVIVLKHRQSSTKKYENISCEDVALVSMMLASAVSTVQLDSAKKYRFVRDVIEL